MDEKKLPRAKLQKDGKLEVEGDKHAFIQGMIRSFTFEVKDLTFHRGYSIEESKAKYVSRISGTAVLRDRDSLEVAGLGDRTREIPFSARPVETASKYDWTAHIGYLPYDWEIGHEAAYYIESYVPNDAWADFEESYMAGRVTNIAVIMETTLWVHEFDWHTPPSGHVTWYLVPQQDRQSDIPAGETGRIKSFGWQETPPLRARSPNLIDEQLKEEQPAYKLGQQWAEETIRTANQGGGARPPIPKKFSWGATVTWAIGIVLVIAFVLSRQQ